MEGSAGRKEKGKIMYHIIISKNKNNLKCALIITTSGSFWGHCQLTLDGFENVFQIFLLFCMTQVILQSVLDNLNDQ